jgi:hypothetical protein
MELEAEIKELKMNLELANFELTQLRGDNTLVNSALSEIGKEKDFYYHKLRDIEVITTKYEVEVSKLRQFIGFILSSDKEIEITADESGNPVLKKFN